MKVLHLKSLDNSIAIRWLMSIMVISLLLLCVPTDAESNETHTFYIGDSVFSEYRQCPSNRGFVTILERTAPEGNTYMGYDFRLYLEIAGMSLIGHMRIWVDDELYYEHDGTLWDNRRYTYDGEFSNIKIEVENRTGVTGVTWKYGVEGHLGLGLTVPTITIINNLIERVEVLEIDSGNVDIAPTIDKVQGLSSATATTDPDGLFWITVQASGATHFRAGTSPGVGTKTAINNAACVNLSPGANTIYVEAWIEGNEDIMAIGQMTAFGL